MNSENPLTNNEEIKVTADLKNDITDVSAANELEKVPTDQVTDPNTEPQAEEEEEKKKKRGIIAWLKKPKGCITSILLIALIVASLINWKPWSSREIIDTKDGSKGSTVSEISSEPQKAIEESSGAQISESSILDSSEKESDSSEGINDNTGTDAVSSVTRKPTPSSRLGIDSDAEYAAEASTSASTQSRSQSQTQTVAPAPAPSPEPAPTPTPTPAPTPAPAPVQTHTHTWVHHDAVTHTVHHDATYTTVHHDAVTEQHWIVDVPSYDIIQCTGCGAQFSTMAEMTAHAEYYAVEMDDMSHGNTVITVPEQGHYETVTVSQAYDETVEATAAWDEVVIDSPAYDECSGCGARQ